MTVLNIPLGRGSKVQHTDHNEYTPQLHYLKGTVLELKWLKDGTVLVHVEFENAVSMFNIRSKRWWVNKKDLTW